MSKIIATLPVIFLLVAVEAGARTLEELRVAYEVKILSLEKEQRGSLSKLKTGYLAELGKVQVKLQKGGRLDDVLPVVEEKKLIDEDTWPLPALVESAPLDLTRARKLYETARIKIDRDHALALIETAEKMEELLKGQVTVLTRSGKITEAKEARDQLEGIGNSEKIKAARELVKRVQLNQDAPIAMRIRRSGDNLEVLVRYDKSGKVSLDSPVENVVELTGGREEKGETSAKVLGEFIGAEGYEADAYVAFESDMEKIVAPMVSTNINLTAGVKIESRSATQMLMPEKATNPRVEWPGLLQPIASNSLIRVEFHYFIPKANKKLQGFAFHWGIAAPFESRVMKVKDRWVSETLESESLKANDTLRLYIENLSGSNKTFNGGNESIYIDDMKVIYLNFAAHLVQSYKDGKPIGEAVVDNMNQESIALAGKLSSSNLK